MFSIFGCFMLHCVSLTRCQRVFVNVRHCVWLCTQTQIFMHGSVSRGMKLMLHSLLHSNISGNVLVFLMCCECMLKLHINKDKSSVRGHLILSPFSMWCNCAIIQFALWHVCTVWHACVLPSISVQCFLNRLSHDLWRSLPPQPVLPVQS